MKESSKDNIYQSKQSVAPFKFDEKVAAVFPDMIQRSVPGYDQIVQGIQSLAARFIKSHTNAYDLGCSLGAASLAMSLGNTAENCQVMAVDNSEAMTKRCQLFVESYHHQTPITVVCSNIETLAIENASMVVLNFTLQFIPMEKRQEIINKIYQGLNPGGVLVLSEKLIDNNPNISELLIDLHHQFKKSNGYSDLEISQKRTALENVLIAETRDDHFARLNQAGFEHLGIWQQQFNFCSIVAIK